LSSNVGGATTNKVERWEEGDETSEERERERQCESAKRTEGEEPERKEREETGKRKVKEKDEIIYDTVRSSWSSGGGKVTARPQKHQHRQAPTGGRPSDDARAQIKVGEKKQQ